jgi:hypothetical protein
MLEFPKQQSVRKNVWDWILEDSVAGSIFNGGI